MSQDTTPVERRAGTSKLVYDKATRTIVTVRSDPPRMSQDSDAGALPPKPWTFERFSGRIRDANGNCIAQVFADEDRHISALVKRIMT